MREIVVFSGSAHTELAEQICKDLGVPLADVSDIEAVKQALQPPRLTRLDLFDEFCCRFLTPPFET